MAPKKAYIERDRHGRERIVIEKRRRGSSTSSRPSTQELLDAAEDREAALIAENNVLRATLSGAQRDSWEFRNLTADYQHLVNEHHQCRFLRAQLDTQVRETRRIEDKLDDEKDKTEKLIHKIHTLTEKNDKLEDRMEVLRRKILGQDDTIRLAETRIEDKNRTIIYLKNYLRNHGFRVE